jgi:hypothetical protein
MEIISKENPTKEEYVMARILSVFGMRKVPKDKIQKMFDNTDIS